MYENPGGSWPPSASRCRRPCSHLHEKDRCWSQLTNQSTMRSYLEKSVTETREIQTTWWLNEFTTSLQKSITLLIPKPNDAKMSLSGSSRGYGLWWTRNNRFRYSLFVKVPQPGGSKVTFSVCESSCHLLLPV